MERNSREWLVPLTGVGFIVLAIVSYIVGGEPKDAKHSPREIVSFWVDNKSSMQVSVLIAVAATVLLIFFGAYLWRTLRDSGGERDILALVSFTGVGLVAVGLALDNTIAFALSAAADDINPTAVQGLQALWDNDFVPLATGGLLFMVGTGLSVIRTGVLPRWMGWAMVVLALTGPTPIGFVAFLGAGLSVLVLSITLSLRARTPSTVVTG
jgi:hypothetical protein